MDFKINFKVNQMLNEVKNPVLRFKNDKGEDYPAWESKRLGEIGEIIMGQSPSSLSYNDNSIGIPLIQGNNDIENNNAYKSD